MRDTIVFGSAGTSDSGTTPPKFTRPVPGPSDTGKQRLNKKDSKKLALEIREGLTEEERERLVEKRDIAIQRVKLSNRNWPNPKVSTPDPTDAKLSKRGFEHELRKWRQRLLEARGGANESGASSSSDPYTTPPPTPRRESDTPATISPTPEAQRKKNEKIDEEINEYIQKMGISKD